MPDVLEIVEDEPVVFMPVYRWGPCKKYGFPQEGVVAFRLRKGNWSPVPAQEFRQDLKVNLFRSIHALFCTLVGRRIVFLHQFVKKTDKTPLKELQIARQRMKEMING